MQQSLKVGTCLAALAALGIVAGAVAAPESKPGESKQAVATGTTAAAVAFPQGIVLKTVRIGKAINVPGSSSSQPQEHVVFASGDKGLSYYTYDKDTPGKPSTCVDACAAEWPAAIAPDNARPVGDWSIIPRGDGAKQWAFRGMPLYHSMKDIKPKDMGYGGPSGALGEDTDGVWHVAKVAPTAWTTVPSGISIAEALAAPGQVLVNAKGRTLYTYDGDPKQDKALLDQWAPVAASQLDLPVGDFMTVSRADGVNQWAYRGKPLYTFRADIEAGDVNGAGLTKGMQAAVVMQYYMPPDVAVMKDQRRGGLLVQASTGKVLYARDRAQWNGTGAHYARGALRGNPATGTAIGLTGCDQECEKTWQPLLAPADATNWGNWTVLNRADGTKQWAYQSYALYTNAGEKAGEARNHDTYDVALNHDTKDLVPANRGFALYWRVTPP